MSWLLLVFTGLVHAAWPDSFEHRIAAMEALRYDFNTPGIPHKPKDVAMRYKVACEKGYGFACKWKEWQQDNGGNPQLAIPIFESKCKVNKAPLACVVLGYGYGLDKGKISNDAPNPKKAFGFFKKACKEKAYAPGCTHMGEMYANGVSVKKDLSMAFSLYEEACKAKDYWGCHRLGEMYFSGVGAKKDLNQARRMYSKACRSGYIQSCIAKSEIVYETTNNKKALREVAKAFGSGCEMGQDKYCLYLADMHAQGRGVSRSLMVATALYLASCEKGLFAGCHGYAEMLLLADEPDIEEAQDRFSEACDRGYAPSCSRYGKYLLNMRGGNTEKALRLLQRGCDSGDTAGCMAIAEVYHYGEKVKQDKDKAKELYKQGCDKEIGSACFALGILSESTSAWGKKDYTSLFRKSCDLGEGRGCGELASRLLKKKGKSKEVNRLFDLGCEGKDPQSCTYLSEFYKEKNDQKKFMQFLEEACHHGGNDACMTVGNHYEKTDPPQVSMALSFYDKACLRQDARACEAVKPIAFRGRYVDVVQGAFESLICQIWAVNPENPEDVLPVSDVRGAQVFPYVGEYRGTSINAIHLADDFSFAVIHEGKSRISVVASAPVQKESVWGEDDEEEESSGVVWGGAAPSFSEELQYIEQWDPSDGKISESYPGDQATIEGSKGVLKYSRDQEQIFLEKSQVGFAVTQSQIQTEHCTPLQALIAGYLILQ